MHKFSTSFKFYPASYKSEHYLDYSPYAIISIMADIKLCKECEHLHKINKNIQKFVTLLETKENIIQEVLFTIMILYSA
jgi:hypothetical protein